MIGTPQQQEYSMQPILLVLFLALALALAIRAFFRYPPHRMHWQRMQQQRSPRRPMRRSADHYRRN